MRGSGKERGHGTELQFCPKCGKDLRPGKHHVGCSAGKSAPRQAAKRQRQVRRPGRAVQGGDVPAQSGGPRSTWLRLFGAHEKVFILQLLFIPAAPGCSGDLSTHTRPPGAACALPPCSNK